MSKDGVTIVDVGTEIYRKFLGVASGEEATRNGRDQAILNLCLGRSERLCKTCLSSSIELVNRR